MIEIVTLFLGLVSGPQPVELAVGAPATAVEIRLDGELVERLTSPPWHLEVDFGEDLSPHELVAIARNEAGRELARVRRWINIDMPQAVVGGVEPPGGLTPLPVVFATDRSPAADAMGTWFLADGRPLAVSAVHAGPAELGGGAGPSYEARPGADGAAIPGLSPRTPRRPGRAAADRLAGLEPGAPANAAGGVPARRSGAVRRGGQPPGKPADRSPGGRSTTDLLGLGDETRVRLISPLAAPVSRTERQRYLFARRSAGVADAGLLWLAETLPPMGFACRVADAVAIAGREAHAGGSRRAVLLLLNGATRDDSLHAAAAVRDYLRDLRVPLFIWTLSPAATPPAWGEARFIGLPRSSGGRSIRRVAIGEALNRLGEAAAELRRELENQRIVLLDGEHLPHQIHLAAAAAGARPAGLERLTGGRGGNPR